MTELTRRRLLSLLLMSVPVMSVRTSSGRRRRGVGRKRDPANRQNRLVPFADEKRPLADTRGRSTGDLTPVRPSAEAEFRILAAVRSRIQNRHVDERIRSPPDDHFRLAPQQIAEVTPGGLNSSFSIRSQPTQ